MTGANPIIKVLRYAAIAWMAAELVLPGLAVYGNDAVPTLRHYAAMEKATSCGSYRRIAAGARLEIENNKRIMKAVRELLKTRRNELEMCARAKGFKAVQTEEQDEALAEACGTAYQAWLAPGYRLEMLREDVHATSDSLRLLTTVLDTQCAEAGPALVTTGQVGPN